MSNLMPHLYVSTKNDPIFIKKQVIFVILIYFSPISASAIAAAAAAGYGRRTSSLRREKFVNGEA